ncbi:MAG: hypothetical protein LUE08_00190 [Akkermansiaceae bacterium]|nr:hypothetical protein [Akkermansiaceae bacterium]
MMRFLKVFVLASCVVAAIAVWPQQLLPVVAIVCYLLAGLCWVLSYKLAFSGVSGGAIGCHLLGGLLAVAGCWVGGYEWVGWLSLCCVIGVLLSVNFCVTAMLGCFMGFAEKNIGWLVAPVAGLAWLVSAVIELVAAGLYLVKILDAMDVILGGALRRCLEWLVSFVS